MKILFYTYPSAFQKPGGGEVQLLKTKEYLKKLGIEVKLFNQWKDKVINYDLVHSFSLHFLRVLMYQFVKSKNKPIAISTIFWPTIEFVLKEKNNS